MDDLTAVWMIVLKAAKPTVFRISRSMSSWSCGTVALALRASMHATYSSMSSGVAVLIHVCSPSSATISMVHPLDMAINISNKHQLRCSTIGFSISSKLSSSTRERSMRSNVRRSSCLAVTSALEVLWLVSYGMGSRFSPAIVEQDVLVQHKDVQGVILKSKSSYVMLRDSVLLSF